MRFLGILRGCLTLLFQGQSLTIDDFELITVIGKGSFGKVSQFVFADRSQIFADA